MMLPFAIIGATAVVAVVIIGARAVLVQFQTLSKSQQKENRDE
jgi:hypothetical protein